MDESKIGKAFEEYDTNEMKLMHGNCNQNIQFTMITLTCGITVTIIK